ncbi:hypothetical protein BUALT_Bualt02G0143100 [Buddleja alternifolia]|uniref:Mating-type protein MAT-1 n=1 Tax=Buddleja alternifolia TaxID=168488 RepID=A0AAV6Y8S2_9LAMI|nr:hypothetical protein BUALT_Bualt02G0143100 [Buddleja alternifolia]
MDPHAAGVEAATHLGFPDQSMRKQNRCPANVHSLATLEWGAENSLAIEVVQWTLCVKFAKEFTFLDCSRHVRKLQKRHRVFNWLVHMAGVLYDHTTNTIIGAPFVWDHICKEQPFAYAYMSEGDPKWTELQVIFNKNPTSNQLFLDNVVNVSSSDEDDSMFIVENGGVLFGPVMQGFPVYDMPLGEAEYPINAPFLQALPVTNVSSDDTRSPDNNFWNDMFEEWGSDSLSGGYVDPNDDLLLQNDAAAVHFLENGQYEPPSPINSLNSIEGFISSSSSASNTPSYGP